MDCVEAGWNVGGVGWGLGVVGQVVDIRQSLLCGDGAGAAGDGDADADVDYVACGHVEVSGCVAVLDLKSRLVPFM